MEQKLNRFFNPEFVGRECAELVGTPKVRVALIEGEVTEPLVRPGILLHLTLLRTRLAAPVPEWLAELEGDRVQRAMVDRCTKAVGLFWAQGGATGTAGLAGYPARPSAQTAPAHWVNWEGTPAHGEQLSEGALFAAVVEHLKLGTFTLEQVETFARHPRILAALRAGAVDHLDAWLVKMTATPAAEFLLNAARHETVPGFTMKMLGKGRPAFLEAIGRIAREASVSELLAHVAAIKNAAPTE
jgi:hypothetical protein